MALKHIPIINHHYGFDVIVYEDLKQFNICFHDEPQARSSAVIENAAERRQYWTHIGYTERTIAVINAELGF